KGVKCILIKSLQPGDGKSFVSLNLAASYALLNKLTIILECDLRKPSIAKSLGVNPSAGIADILARNSPVDDLIIEVPGYDGHLFLLPAGGPSSNSAELISGAGMESLVKSLKDQFDYIVIDSPASDLVADAELLRQYADLTLIVLRQNHSSIEILKRAKFLSGKTSDKPAFILLNDVVKNSYRRNY
ncbi:MAG: tyrosine-protein kinase family protein, partial [Flavobacterium sp.]